MPIPSRPILILLTLTLVSMPVALCSEAPPSAQRMDTVNYVLGTQTIGITYTFTGKTGLVETAERIHEMGSNVLKFSMSPRMEEQYGLPKREDIRSLADLASREPSVKTVLDMPFAYYLIWVYPFAHRDAAWTDGLSEKERREAYEEVHALAAHLLKTYSGTGKTFLLGHWEGDWYLHPNYDPKQDPNPEAIQGMIDWLNVRQAAIDAAKNETSAKDVSVCHYTEVNLVRKGMKGGVCLVNNVLPHTKVDYVSYSSWDTINPHKGGTRKALHDALDYIESKLPPKAGIPGKRVFIGEYGFALETTKTPQRQDRYSRDVCRAALEWGCPFVLYWEMYCNETSKDKHRGLWLIDDKNQKQPFYHTLQSYYENMRRFVEAFGKEHGRLPTDSEIRKKALEILKQDPGEQGANGNE
ncbi:MAG: hypothetical protein V1809_06780 [Planctomycetota bacterium]